MAGNKQPTTKDILIQLKGEVDASFKELLTSVKQLNTGVGDLNKSLSKNTAESLDETNKKLEKTSKDADDAGKKTKGLAKTFEGLGARIRTFAQYRVINAVASSIKDLGSAAIKLESNFANIQAITSATDTEMGKLRNTILSVGEASKYSVEEIARATTMLGQAGLSADEINNVLETTTQLAAGTGSELSNTVDLMTSALAVWGLNSEEASHLSDVMVTSMNRTKATLETFRMAVQYAGATVASLNGNFEDLASVSAAASNAGLRASVIGTGLRATIAELTTPTKKMTAGLAKLGLTTEDVNIKSRGLIPVLETLRNSGLSAADAYGMFGRRAVQFVLAATNQLDVIHKLNDEYNKGGSTLKAYAKQMDTVAAQWTALANTIKESAYRISQETRGFIADTLRWFRKGLAELMETEEDPTNRAQNSIKERYDNIKNYLLKLDKLRGSSDINKINKLIQNINEKYGSEFPLVEKLEDVSAALDEVEKKLRNVEKAEIDAFNKSNIDEMFDIREREFDKVIKSVNKDFTGGIEYNLKGGKNQAWNIFEEQREQYLDALKKGGSSVDIEQGIKARFNKFWPSVEEIIQKKLFLAALDAAEKEVENVGENLEKTFTSTESYRDLNEKALEIEESFKSLDDSIFGDNSKLTLTAESLKKLIEDQKAIVDAYNESVENAIKEGKITNEGKEKEKIENESINVMNAYNDWLLGLLSKAEELFKAMAASTQYSKIGTEGLSAVSSMKEEKGFADIHQTWLDRLKNDKYGRRSQREIERDKARQFNLKYQGLAIQQQADSYQADIEQARRKGMKSRYDQLDKTGTIGSAYSRYSADKERLEKFKTAYANQETLDKYMKDYGDLFKQVESGKVSLEDADNKSDKLISKMIELQKSTEEARAEFGDLNESNLEDVNEQITELDEKMKQLDEDSKTTFGQMKIGFQDAVKKMAESYSMANLGATIAQDLGNGMADALNSIVDGSKSAKDAFSDMARSILQDISKMLIRMAVLKAMEAGVGMFGSKGGVQVYNSPIGPALPQANGGFIPKLRAATGAMVRGGIQGKDSVPAMLMPGEYVLKKSAVDALGTNFLNDLNNNAAQTLTNTAANMMQNSYESGSESEPSVVNVWVVSKEEEAQMGPNDVIATISKDIMTGGQTRRLIQSVVAGRK